MKIRYIVFDFDGTLVDSREVFLSVYNSLAGLHGLIPIDHTNEEALKELSMLGRMQALKIPLWKLPLLIKQFLAAYKKQIASIDFVPGIEEVLVKLQQLDIKLAIVSSNDESIIRMFLKNNDVDSIAEIYCSDKIFGKDRILKKLLSRNQLHPSEMVYICDESRDIKACRKLNIKTIWVGWGFETISGLGEDIADETATTPEDLFEKLQRMIRT